jgi:ferric-dicitrate binding protein FerR (iron transport regulator)
MVNGTASESEISRWNNWMEDRDENRAKAKKAIAEIAGFEFQDPIQLDMEEEWQRLYDTTVGKKDPNITYVPDRHSNWQWIYRIAAILIIGTLVGVGLYVYPENKAPSTQVEQITEEHTVSTGAGEHKTIRFSNGSAITLNSNSSVTYTLGLLHNQTIEVVLEGEAYFDAEGGDEDSEPIFAVRTPDGIVRDIGTEFLVTIRNGHSSVVLQEGKVEVDNESRGKEEVKKGEMLKFTKSEVLDRQIVNPTFYTSWATGTMEFNETSIDEFARFVEQQFGVEVEVTDAKLSEITLDGAVYFKSLEGLVRSVSEVTKIPVYQSADRETVYIGKVKETVPANKNQQ